MYYYCDEIDEDSQHNPPGWESHVHPEGAPYFFHPEKRVLTEANLYDETTFVQIHCDIKTIDDFLRAQNIRLPQGADLVLDLLPSPSGGTMTGYYFADYTNRCFFFLDSFDTANTTGCSSVTGVTSIAHVRHEIEANYWYHCFLFPTICELKAEMVDELRDIVLHAMGDVMTSTTSTVPYTAEDLQNILSISNGLRSINCRTHFGGSMCIYSRLMSIFVRQRFLNFHGQPSARLNRDQSAMWVDRMMWHTAWSQFIRKLNDEWQELTLYATVLLNANVAFLAIQSIDRALNEPRSPIQITSYVSTIISIASILLGLLLVRHYRTKAKANSDDAATFLIQRHPTLGLEALAIMYSLPYALLMWAMVSFLAAFTLMCLLESDFSTRSLVIATWIVMAALIGWSIWIITRSSHKPPRKRWMWFNFFRRCSRTSGAIFAC
ncbi:hypothetical protein BD779DRAFT_1520584 [Infundibulicybe gibba]|nr:hypothetical protein BD779DRAFT_1520584 [Infundibulicybe gibba]